MVLMVLAVLVVVVVMIDMHGTLADCDWQGKTEVGLLGIDTYCSTTLCIKTPRI
jgi:hypothetical protein